MNIQVNTDHNIAGSAELNGYVETHLSEVLNRFKVAITRIEVHLSAGGMDKRCLIEARISHQQPIVVSHHDNNIHHAIEKASDKLLRALIHMQGKLSQRTSIKDMVPEESISAEEGI